MHTNSLNIHTERPQPLIRPKTRLLQNNRDAVWSVMLQPKFALMLSEERKRVGLRSPVRKIQ
mgnify:CR=1 FL=1